VSDQSQTPIFGEILASDQLYGYTGATAFNTVGLSSLDPSVLWPQLQTNLPLAMAIYEDLEDKDDVVGSCLDQRYDAVIALPRRVLPATDKLRDKKVAEFIAETLDGDSMKSGDLYSGLDQLLYETLDAVGKGLSIGEIIFADDGDKVGIEEVKFKPQGLFTFNSVTNSTYFGPQDGPLRLRSWTGIAGVGEDGLLPQNKFLVASYRPKKGNRLGSAIDRRVFWQSFFKRSGMKVWLRYLEKGPGTVVARYPDGAGAAEQQKALDAARAVAEEIAVGLANKFNVKVEENVRQSMGSSHKELVDEICADAIMRVILGQTLTARGGDGGGGWSKGDVHQQVRAEKKEADSKFLMRVINQCLVKPLVLFNFGPSTPLPLWVIDYKPRTDESADSIIYTRYAGAGLKIPTKFIYEKHNIPQPTEDEECLTAPAQAPRTPSTGVDPAAADFAEKKTSLDDPSKPRQRNKPDLKIQRFKSLRRSTTRSSSE
jgi:phage gp29-like protein